MSPTFISALHYVNPFQDLSCSLAVQGNIMLPFLQTFLNVSLILIHFLLSTQSRQNSQVKAIVRLPQPELEPTFWGRRVGEYWLPKGIWDVGMKEEGRISMSRTSPHHILSNLSNLHASNKLAIHSISLFYF